MASAGLIFNNRSPPRKGTIVLLVDIFHEVRSTSVSSQNELVPYLLLAVCQHNNLNGWPKFSNLVAWYLTPVLYFFRPRICEDFNVPELWQIFNLLPTQFYNICVLFWSNTWGLHDCQGGLLRIFWSL